MADFEVVDVQFANSGNIAERTYTGTFQPGQRIWVAFSTSDDGAGTINNPSEWAKVFERVYTSDNGSVTIWTKVAAGGEETITVTCGGPTNASMHIIRSVDPVVEWGLVDAPVWTSGSTNQLTLSSIDPGTSEPGAHMLVVTTLGNPDSAYAFDSDNEAQTLAGQTGHRLGSAFVVQEELAQLVNEHATWTTQRPAVFVISTWQKSESEATAQQAAAGLVGLSGSLSVSVGKRIGGRIAWPPENLEVTFAEVADVLEGEIAPEGTVTFSQRRTLSLAGSITPAGNSADHLTKQARRVAGTIQPVGVVTAIPQGAFKILHRKESLPRYDRAKHNRRTKSGFGLWTRLSNESRELTIWKDSGGQWHEGYPTIDEVNDAEVIYFGGHDNRVSFHEAQELEAAGFKTTLSF